MNALFAEYFKFIRFLVFSKLQIGMNSTFDSVPFRFSSSSFIIELLIMKWNFSVNTIVHKIPKYKYFIFVVVVVAVVFFFHFVYFVRYFQLLLVVLSARTQTRKRGSKRERLTGVREWMQLVEKNIKSRRRIARETKRITKIESFLRVYALTRSWYQCTRTKKNLELLLMVFKKEEEEKTARFTLVHLHHQ